MPRAKSGRPRSIHLNSAALDLLRAIERTDGNPFIFPSPVTGRPSPSLHFPWWRIRERAGLLDVRLHDLRHSFASFLVNQGVSLYVVQGLLGHTQARTTQRYAHLANDTLADAAEVVRDVILEPAVAERRSGRRRPRRLSHQFARHAHFKSAVWQFLKRDTGLLEHFVDSNFRLMPRTHRCFFKPINGALRDLGPSAEFCLTPTQHRPRRPHPRREQQRIRVHALATLPCAGRIRLGFH